MATARCHTGLDLEDTENKTDGVPALPLPPMRQKRKFGRDIELDLCLKVNSYRGRFGVSFSGAWSYHKGLFIYNEKQFRVSHSLRPGEQVPEKFCLAFPWHRKCNQPIGQVPV